MKKKILIALLGAVCACTVGLAACEGEKENSTPEAQKSLAFTLDNDVVDMFGQKQLAYDYENIEGNIVFTSSDSSIATIDEMGKVTARKSGNVTITMTADGMSDTISLTVLACDETKLELFYEFDTLNLYETYSKKITPVVLYDERIVDGGEFTYSIAQSGNAILSGDTVIGVNKGDATLTISGSIAGITLGDVVVSINVFEKLEIALETTKETIFVSEGTHGQNAKTEFSLNPKVMLNDKEVTGADIITDIVGEDVIEIADGKVSAVGVGTAVVTFSYTTEKDTFAQSTLTVVVDKPTATFALDEGVISKNKSEFIEFAVTGATTVSELLYDELVVASSEYQVVDGVLKINPTAFANYFGDSGVATEHSVQITAENDDERFVYTQTFKLIDFEIGTAAEFAAWALSVVAMTDKNSTVPTYVLLTDSIDLSTEVFLNTKWDTKPEGKTSHDGFGYGYLCGEFDGQGFTVDSLEHCRGGLFAGVAKGGFSFKNVAFTNISLNKPDATARYIFGSSMTGKLTLENVYLQVAKVGAATATSEISIVNDCGMLAVKNCVVDFAFTYADGAPTYTKAPIFRNRAPQYGLQNCFGITATPWFYSSSYEWTEKTGFAYENYASFGSYAAIKNAIAEETVSMADFSTDVWDTENGAPVFKSAVEFMNFPTAIAVAVEGASGEFIEAGEYAFKALDGTTFTLANAVDGVSIEDGKLVVAATAANGAQITINATYTDPIFGYTANGTVTYTVQNIMRVTVEGTKSVALNRNECLVLDLSAYGTFATTEISFAKLGEKDVTATIEDGKFTVAKAQLVSGAYTLKISIDKGIIYEITASVKVNDYAIGTVDEFVAWATAESKATGTTATYAVLTANIDLTNEAFINTNYAVYTGTRKNTHNGFGLGTLYGEFDGQGFTVDGLEHDRGALFYKISSGGYTFKNVAFTNISLAKVESKTNDTRYIFASSMIGKITLENVYLQVTSVGGASAANQISIVNDCGMLAVKNCVVDFAFTYADGAPTYTASPIFRNRSPQYGTENFFAITKTSLLAPGNELSGKEDYTYANYACFASVDALKAAVTAQTVSIESFTSEYWDTTAGYPVWKNLPRA